MYFVTTQQITNDLLITIRTSKSTKFIFTISDLMLEYRYSFYILVMVTAHILITNIQSSDDGIVMKFLISLLDN